MISTISLTNGRNKPEHNESQNKSLVETISPFLLPLYSCLLPSFFAFIPFDPWIKWIV